MDFYNKVGKMALGSRLRRLSEKLTEQAGEVYNLYDIDMQPKWFPVFYSLAGSEEKSIMQIAQEIGHSHPSVSIIVKEMTKKGLVTESPNKSDGRKNYIRLTEAGQLINNRIQNQYTDVNAAIETALQETQHNIWKAIEEWEFLLEQKDLFKRVQQEKKLRESEHVEIVAYHPQYKAAFKALNEEWITTYFKIEESDYKALDHPEEYILDKGGFILFALYHGEPLGTCALIKMDNQTFELAKMAVSPKAKGKGMGWLLGNAAIEKARAEGATRVYLESNTILKPAINLYHKLGFKKVTGIVSPYERCNIQMELCL
ncbi:bifunctional helix-turn-helix transcriptional regulator/GNAT family N-acetyltransferase [Mucilaginibacter lacusdianchii]|uniref:bifunctional helix-turn-helix transcriptional regulator/GNAT family N-acetyltransferase n=1 Tax=Mucilaginibacter lacusdianchii TaxID=2684211 RepID=UPI00131D4B49|nr:bifunctional helix-turn-helix transcriptional regulator/GNAT family N-acetyltransferase [Mucilaginibacter sp. JXJ CY 39]